MKVVNPHFLSVFLVPITGLADADEAIEHYKNIELLTEEQYKEVIRETLVEYFQNLEEDVKRKSKLALSYCLTKPTVDFESVFESLLPPFDLPPNARDFFLWLWEELFIGESYELADAESYKVVADMYEPLRSTKN
ncbi:MULTISPECIES: hypothetical protein [Brevibacillus]|jgi:hypothetical protein|uniref:Uncharacterized protein n=1 Tax=Brevibacillus parabrevis TaxID=54914 RepID=A0A4Y3PIX4_BREPA|nr:MULTISPECIES: hypothetical protein [Brevibacillus]MBU8712570.1 hypothetical protein [Brevibacillus parabrevis]MED2256820.1 hypothetical protein [Brevibacillus parabrevis]NRQ52597.1 hypothetical protein [Brevibacillus sp. HD1.4A]RNB96436.1 hypothetical protein EDM60_03655 [Brevibacillus parabrevis]WDV96446.1 hypothetical protein PSE45_05730 [Brevibacillus parabrevis]